MATLSPAPRRLRTPSWFDPRLLLGVALVVGSVVLGAVVISRANSTRPVIALDRDLAAGTVLTNGDVRVVQVRLSGRISSYARTSSAVVGQALLRALDAGELLPTAAIGPADPDETTLTVPVKPENSPDVERGQRVAIWVSTQYCQAMPVLEDVTVQQVHRAGSGSLSASTQSLVVRTPQPLAQRVVTALGLDGATVRVGVLSGTADPNANAGLPLLDACAAPKKSS